MVTDSEALRVALKALNEIASQGDHAGRLDTWCSRCKAWVQIQSKCGDAWCKECGGGVGWDNGDRYEEIAKVALEAIR